MTPWVLTADELRALLAEFKAGLAALYGGRLRGVYLFGSYARGEQRDDSDVDVLVVLDRIGRYSDEINWCIDLLSNLSLDHTVTVCPVFVTEAAWRYGDTMFLANVREDGLPV